MFRIATAEEVDELGIFLFGPHPRPDIYPIPDDAPVSYDVYLQSPSWRYTRQQALRRALMRCQMCNSSELLEVHHRTYERLGYEAPEDLTVLCRWCHARHHNKAVR